MDHKSISPVRRKSLPSKHECIDLCKKDKMSNKQSNTNLWRRASIKLSNESLLADVVAPKILPYKINNDELEL